MALLAELQQARRNAARSQEDAKRALELAYLEAQKQWGDKLAEVESALMVRQAGLSRSFLVRIPPTIAIS